MSERGVVESTQWALLIPTLMLVLVGTIQAGVWLHGRNVASSAAAAAAEHVAWQRGADAESEAMGRRIAQAGGLTDVQVAIQRQPGSVRVTVSGRAPVLIDLGLGAVSELALMPMEVTRP